MDNCPRPCSPTALPSQSLKLCNDTYDYLCALGEFVKSTSQELESYSSPCTKFEYKLNDMASHHSRIDGFPNIIFYDDAYDKIIVWLQDWNGKPTVQFTYGFEYPNMVTVFEEYLVFSWEDLVGLVGGNVGLFIGLSFADVISNLFKLGKIILKKSVHFLHTRRKKEVKKKQSSLKSNKISSSYSLCVPKKGTTVNPQPPHYQVPQVNTSFFPKYSHIS